MGEQYRKMIFVSVIRQATEVSEEDTCAEQR